MIGPIGSRVLFGGNPTGDIGRATLDSQRMLGAEEDLSFVRLGFAHESYAFGIDVDGIAIHVFKMHKLGCHRSFAVVM
ncbi:hypothetical protein ABD05_14560 [Burkholderia pyrrocinia]|nr:hypothetical protein ABD05_14560 [Burkholderia pyrrocinia]